MTAPGGLRTVHQLVPHLAPGDAVSTHALQARQVLRGLGLRSELYAGAVDGLPGAGVRPARRLRWLRSEPGLAVVYQAAVGSPVADLLPALVAAGVPLVLNHHTSSPPEAFDPWDRHLAGLLRLARHQLAALAPLAAAGIAVSEHNAVELRAAGCRRVEVAPVLRAAAVRSELPDAATVARLDAAKVAGGADWLFVGRLAPNKAQHDVVRAFAAFRATVDPRARLRLVGSPAVPRYAEALAELVAGLGLGAAVELTGPVSDAALAAHYGAADVFVCLSDHEGFCVPLLEALDHAVPVVAFDAGAVGETLGSAGVLLPDKSPAVVATAVARVLADRPLRDALARAGSDRLAHYAPASARHAFAAALVDVLGCPS